MRVTEFAKSQLTQRYIAKGQERVQHPVNQIASGLKYFDTSEAPEIASRTQRVRAKQAVLERYLQNGERIEGELDAADGALMQANDIMIRMRELAMQMGSGPKPDPTFDDAAGLVSQLKEALIDVANTQHDGRFIFGGVADNAAPIDAAGAFVGSATVRSVNVADSTTIEGLSGDTLFAGAGGGEHLFTLMDDFEAALVARDQTTVLGLIQRFEDAQSQVNQGRNHYGNELESLTHSRSFIEGVVLGNKDALSELVDTDIIEAASRLESAQQQLQATAQVEAEIQQLDILRYL